MPPEAPAHQATVKSFWMDAPEVTVSEFARFVKATGYVTASEAEWEYAAGSRARSTRGAMSCDPEVVPSLTDGRVTFLIATWARMAFRPARASQFSL